MQKAFAISSGLISVLLAVLAPGPVGAVGLELEGRYWLPDVDGVARLAEIELPPDLDVARLLGVEADGVPEGRLTFRIVLGFYVRAAYQRMSNSGQRTLEEIIDLPLPIDGTLRSDLDFDYGRLALGWRFVLPEKIFSVGVFAEAKGFSGDASASFQSPVFTESISESFEAVLPSVGAVLEVNPTDKFQVFLEGSAEVGYDEASMLDWELGVRYFPAEIFGIGAGYRSMDLDGVIDEVVLDVDWNGAFFTALLRF